jgi:chromosomal replication initiation ATPase DnaA
MDQNQNFPKIFKRIKEWQKNSKVSLTTHPSRFFGFLRKGKLPENPSFTIDNFVVAARLPVAVNAATELSKPRRTTAIYIIFMARAMKIYVQKR